MVRSNSSYCDVLPLGPRFRGSQKDFARALRALGGDIVPDSRVAGVAQPRSFRVVLTCAYEDWMRAVGEHRKFTEHYDTNGRLLFHAWDYRCTDGLVLCVGSRHQREGGNAWITIKAIYLL